MLVCCWDRGGKSRPCRLHGTVSSVSILHQQRNWHSLTHTSTASLHVRTGHLKQRQYVEVSTISQSQFHVSVLITGPVCGDQSIWLQMHDSTEEHTYAI